jgi:hypothetical protein
MPRSSQNLVITVALEKLFFLYFASCLIGTVLDQTFMTHSAREFGFGLGSNKLLRGKPFALLITDLPARNADWKVTPYGLRKSIFKKPRCFYIYLLGNSNAGVDFV